MLFGWGQSSKHGKFWWAKNSWGADWPHRGANGVFRMARGVDTAFVRERIAASGKNPDDLPPDTLMSPRSVAESYWVLYHQTRDGWTHELDLRPYGETW